MRLKILVHAARHIFFPDIEQSPCTGIVFQPTYRGPGGRVTSHLRNSADVIHRHAPYVSGGDARL